MALERYHAERAAFDWRSVRKALGWGESGPVSLGRTIVDRHVANDLPALIWIGEGGDEIKVSYRELSEASSRFANVLRQRGVVPGDRVAGLMPRVPDTLVCILGALKAGAIYVPMFTGFGPDALRFRLEHSGAGVVVTHHAVRDQLPAEMKADVICVEGTGERVSGDLDFARELAQASREFSETPRDRESIATLIYTSGSTGQPKGGALAVNFLAAIWPYIAYGIDLREDDVLWPTGDPGWGYGFVCYLGALSRGATVVSLQPNPSADLALAVLERHGVTKLATTPTLLRGIMALGGAKVGSTRAKLQNITSCGEPLNAKVVEFFRETWGLAPMDHFGATELALPIGNYETLDVPVRAGSMGVPSPGFDISIVDDAGVEVPRGTIGFLASRSDPDNRYWMNYWNDEAASRDLVRDGRIVTGDLARCDEDGYFWFEGRAGDMIKSAGYRIGPFEIESALLHHPAVAEAAVVGKPDELRGEIVKAWITLRPGFKGSDALSKELTDLVRIKLGRHQYPREISYVENLPKTETGKIQRFMLRQQS